MRPYFNRKKLFLIPIGIVAFAALVGYLVMGLWNWLMPLLFHLGTITFWQALGLFLLCKILFGFGHGPKGGGGGHWMRHRMEERFKNMSPEEREQFKEKWREKCRHGRWDYRDMPYDKDWEKKETNE